jgi:hypothetical protein
MKYLIVALLSSFSMNEAFAKTLDCLAQNKIEGTSESIVIKNIESASGLGTAEVTLGDLKFVVTATDEYIEQITIVNLKTKLDVAAGGRDKAWIQIADSKRVLAGLTCLLE